MPQSSPSSSWGFGCKTGGNGLFGRAAALLLIVGTVILLLPAPTLDDAGAAPPGPANLEALHREYDRLVADGYVADDFLSAFREQLGSRLPLSRRGSAVTSTPAPSAVRDFVQQVQARFQSTSHVLLKCTWDRTLPLNFSGRFFIASNQHNSARIMPNLVAQLLHLVVLLPRDSVFVSVYESGSTDSTVQWLQLLQLLLSALDIPAHLRAGGNLRLDLWQDSGTAKVSTPRGHLYPGELPKDRIQFLAAVRNAALQPLQHFKRAHHERVQAMSAWVPDHIVFLNDVYFCARDIVRLMQQRSADLACGLDVSRTLGGRPLLQRMLPLPVEFYDYWVARDADGQRFGRYAPYASHPTSVRRMRQGLPFRTACCWNGLAMLRAAPFLEGLRFRARVDVRECDASECGLLCEDLHRLHGGGADVVVDPGVRVAYDVTLARELDNGLVEQSAVLPWASVAAAKHYSQLGVQPPWQVECCPKLGNGPLVDWGRCSMVPLRGPGAINFTAIALRDVHYSPPPAGT